MLCDRLKERRKEKGVTQKDVASFLEMSVSTYQKYELSIIEPNNTTLRALAGYFGCSTDYLLGLTEYKAEHEKTKLFHALSAGENQVLMQDPELLTIIQKLINAPDFRVCLRELLELSEGEQQDIFKFIQAYRTRKFSKTDRRVLRGSFDIITAITFASQKTLPNEE
ncbi:MAG: helix-turn-helix domain-containing protein [Defluviitaleaceae bacterium]|nr:helix-turn-helix domain-containing protein [Defluviitaleaceae bacterium]